MHAYRLNGGIIGKICVPDATETCRHSAPGRKDMTPNGRYWRHLNLSKNGLARATFIR